VKPLLRFHRYFTRPVPAERLAALRIVTGLFALGYLLVRAPHFLGLATLGAHDFEPVGIVRLLVAPLPPLAHYLVFAASIVSGTAFVAGAWYRASGPVFALLFLWITTYRCSFGMIFHQDNVLALHLLLLAPATAATLWSWDAGQRPSTERSRETSGWPVRAMAFVTVVSYVLAGVAKLKNVGWEWGTGDVLRQHIAYDALRKLELGGVHSPVGAWLVQYPAVFPVLGALTLLLELGAPLALLGRRAAWVWVVGVWIFHLGVVILMAIGFAYPLSGCAFASLFAIERVRHARFIRRFWPTEPAVRPAATLG
jgi:hypothetical protein